jgi:hypothetical protein
VETDKRDRSETRFTSTGKVQLDGRIDQRVNRKLELSSQSIKGPNSRDRFRWENLSRNKLNDRPTSLAFAVAILKHNCICKAALNK